MADLTKKDLYFILNQGVGAAAGGSAKAVNLSGVDLSGMDLRGVCFDYVQLRFANFRGSDLTNATFKFADIQGAIFTATVGASAARAATNASPAIGLGGKATTIPSLVLSHSCGIVGHCGLNRGGGPSTASRWRSRWGCRGQGAQRGIQ